MRLGNPSTALKKKAEESPFSIAYLDPERTVSYGALNQLVERAGASLRHAGLVQWESVGLYFSDQLLTLAFTLAAIRFGHPILLLQPNRGEAPVSLALLKSNTSHVFTDRADNDLPKIDTHLIADINVLTQSTLTVPEHEAIAWPTSLPVFCFLGSGTTGSPKVIAHNEDAILDMMTREMMIAPFLPRDRIMSLADFSYFAALRPALGAIAKFGTAVTVSKIISIPWLINFCQRMKVDHISMGHLHGVALLKDLSNQKPALPELKSLTLSSSPIPGTMRERLIKQVSPNLRIVYGTNEFGTATHLNYANRSSVNPASVGPVLAAVGTVLDAIKIRIVDSSGTELPVGEVGQIEMYSGATFFGYLTGEENPMDSSGWHKSGDLGQISAEGELIFAGRADDMMIFNGINIYPREIEYVLEQNSQLDEVAVVSAPSSVHGDIPIAFVSSLHSDLDVGVLLEDVTKALGTKAPKRIIQLEALPRNTAGKILKRELVEMVTQIES